MAHMGGNRTTHTGVNNSYGGKKPGLEKETIMIAPGVYKTRTAALVVHYAGYNEDDEDIPDKYKVKLTLPEKWLEKDTPVLMLKEFFMKVHCCGFRAAVRAPCEASLHASQRQRAWRRARRWLAKLTTPHSRRACCTGLPQEVP